MTPNCPGPVGMLESRRTATRVMLGAICLSSSSHFPLMLYSNAKNPVAVGPAQLRQPLQERCGFSHSIWIVRCQYLEHADASHSLGLLRTRHRRPCSRAPEPRDELSSFHSITSSARTSSPVGNSIPR